MDDEGVVPVLIPTDTSPSRLEQVLAKIEALTDVIEALDGSGIRFKESAAIVRTPSHACYIIFEAADPHALVAVGEAIGERGPSCSTAWTAARTSTGRAKPSLDA